MLRAMGTSYLLSLLATPLFGFSLHLTVSPSSALTDLDESRLALNFTQGDAGGSESGLLAESEDSLAVSPRRSPSREVGADRYSEQMRQRAALARIHRPLGIATYAAMAGTVVLGGIQYYNLYGFFAGRDSNPCARGDAVFGQGQCSGTPWPHLAAAIGTSALYASTFTVSLMMPDPGNLSAGNSEYAKNLRMHKLLRWVHFGGMLLQMVLGYVTANAERFGMDRANNYGALQALGTVHTAAGLVTFGAMTWGMLIML